MTNRSEAPVKKRWWDVKVKSNPEESLNESGQNLHVVAFSSVDGVPVKF